MQRLIVAGFFILALAGPAAAGATGPYHSFSVCEIAHPDTCYDIGDWKTLAACRDMLGTFLCHHNAACHVPTSDCACNGPGIAELAGFDAPGDCDQPRTEFGQLGQKAGWYAFQGSALVRYRNLKACRAASHHCFGIGLENFEQGFSLP